MRLQQFDVRTKLLKHAGKLEALLQGDKVSPITVEFDPVGYCNHHCPFCLYQEIHTTMPRDMMWRTLDEIAAIGTKALTWTGSGEPLLSADTPDGMHHAGDLGLQQGIFTNASHVNDRTLDAFEKYFLWVRVSLDAGSESTYSQVHHSSDWKKVVQNIRQIGSIRPRKFMFGVGYVVTNDDHVTYDDLEMTVRLAQECGADYVHFKPDYRPDRMLSPEKAIIVSEALDAFEKSFSTEQFRVLGNLKFQGIQTNERKHYRKCLGSRILGQVAYNKVWFCVTQKGTPGFEVGDLAKESFTEIWQSDRFEQLAERIDVSQCPVFCNHHEINKILWDMGYTEILHPNFF